MKSVNYNSFLSQDYKLPEQNNAPKKRAPFTRLHAVIILASIILIATVASFTSNEVKANLKAGEPQTIPFNKTALSQIHVSLTPLKVVKAPVLSQVETKSKPHQTPHLEESKPSLTLKQTTL